MGFITLLFSNKLLSATFLSWFVAQFLKVMLVYLGSRELDVSRFFGSGGMPSSHSSSIVTLATCILRKYGYSSTEFALAAVFSIIVMYDASGVRLAASHHAIILNKILDIFEDGESWNGKLKELLGHTPLEVLAGAILGVIVGMLVQV